MNVLKRLGNQSGSLSLEYLKLRFNHRGKSLDLSKDFKCADARALIVDDEDQIPRDRSSQQGICVVQVKKTC
jgi:hypothetical protein